MCFYFKKLIFRFNNNDSIIFLEQNNINNENSLKKSLNFENEKDDYFGDENNFKNNFSNPNLNSNFNSNRKNNNNNNYNNTGNSANQINALKKKFILDQIKFSLTNLFNIINNKLEILKYKSFLELKDYLKKRKINLLKAEIILENFQNMMVNLTKIYAKFQKIKFSKYILKWKKFCRTVDPDLHSFSLEFAWIWIHEGKI